jgi:hypothetical protein
MNENRLANSYDAMLTNSDTGEVKRVAIIPERYNWDFLRECLLAVQSGEATADQVLDALWTEQYERQRDVRVACDGSTFEEWAKRTL